MPIYKYSRKFDKETERHSYVHDMRVKVDIDEQKILQENNTMPNRFDDYSISSKKISENKAAIGNSIIATNARYKQLLEACVTINFNEMFLEALPLDEEFKEDHRSSFCKVIKNKLAEAGDIYDVVNKMEHSGVFLHEMAKKCKDKCKEALDKDEDVEGKDLILDKSADSVEATETIKNKVIDVIKKETENNEQEKKLNDEINELKAEGLSESYFTYNKEKIQRFTLFKSLMINTYKTALSESIQLNESTAFSKKVGDDKFRVDMDMVLSESIIQYTLLEMMHTIKYDTLSRKEAVELSDRYAYCTI